MKRSWGTVSFLEGGDKIAFQLFIKALHVYVIQPIQRPFKVAAIGVFAPMKPFYRLRSRKAQSKAEPNAIGNMRIKTLQMMNSSVNHENYCE